MNKAKGKLRSMLFTTVALWMLAPPLSAHHGTAISYDMQHPTTIKGKVTELKWQNPHSYILFDVTDEKGNVVNWAGELTAALIMTENGWPKVRAIQATKPGTPVIVTIAPARSGAHVGLVRTILNEKGEKLLSIGETRQE